VINLAAGFVIRPVLTALTDMWNGRRFDAFAKKLLGISRIIGALSILAVALTAGLGRPVLWVLEQILGSGYEGKLTQNHIPFILIVMGGACYAFLNLHYYALVIMRRQKTIFGIYLVMAVAGAVVAPRMVKHSGIQGAAAAYLVLMAVMAAGFAGLAWYGYRKTTAGRQAG